jgi:predicted nucleic acid-binding protein
VSIVLDAHGLTMLTRNRACLEALRRRGEWPAVLPSVVLTEALTGDHRRDFHENRLLRTCDIRPVEEELARAAASLRPGVTGRLPSATDAIVVALADQLGGGIVLTSDRKDLTALAARATNAVRIVPA